MDDWEEICNALLLKSTKGGYLFGESETDWIIMKNTNCRKSAWDYFSWSRMVFSIVHLTNTELSFQISWNQKYTSNPILHGGTRARELISQTDPVHKREWGVGGDIQQSWLRTRRCIEGKHYLDFCCIFIVILELQRIQMHQNKELSSNKSHAKQNIILTSSIWENWREGTIESEEVRKND
jgi:hypothetical protein